MDTITLIAKPFIVLLVKVIVAVPDPFMVTNPVEDTVAILVEEEAIFQSDQLLFTISFCFLYST